jgi:hypothetical protein
VGPKKKSKPKAEVQCHATKYVTELFNKNVTVRERWEWVILVGGVVKLGEIGGK